LGNSWWGGEDGRDVRLVSGGGPVEVEGGEVGAEEGEVPDAGEVIGFGDEEAGAVGAEGEGGDDGAEVVFDAGDGGAV
jgi:hypothetical protein